MPSTVSMKQMSQRGQQFTERNYSAVQYSFISNISAEEPDSECTAK